MSNSENISDYKGDFGGSKMRTRIKRTRPLIEMMTRKQRRTMVFQRPRQGKLMILMTMMKMMRRTQSQNTSLRIMLEIISLNIEMRGQSMMSQSQHLNLNRYQSPRNQKKISPQNIHSQSLNLSQMIIKTRNSEKIEFDLNKML